MTKILVTIGPASTNSEVITEFAKHTKLFRLNGSHNTLEWHKKLSLKSEHLFQMPLFCLISQEPNHARAIPNRSQSKKVRLWFSEALKLDLMTWLLV